MPFSLLYAGWVACALRTRVEQHHATIKILLAIVIHPHSSCFRGDSLTSFFFFFPFLNLSLIRLSPSISLSPCHRSFLYLFRLDNSIATPSITIQTGSVSSTPIF